MATNKPNLSRVWASDAESSKVVDPDTTFADKYISGYTAEQPYYEHFNFLFNQFSAALAHNNEQGINLWDSETTYPIGAYAKANSSLYTAVSENTNIDPTTDGGTNWVPFVIGPFSASGNSAGLNTSTPLLANGDAGAVFQILNDTRSAFRGTVSGGGGDIELRAYSGGNSHLINFGSGNLNVGTNGSTSMTFLANGNANYSGGSLGVGTSSPDGNFEVTNTGFNLSGTTAYYNIRAGDGGDGVRIGYDTTGGGVIAGIGTNPIRFVTFNGASWGERLNLGATGDLTIQGGRFYLKESDLGNDAVVLTRDADEGYIQAYSGGTKTVELRGAGNSFINGGKLGVNIAVPLEELHVVGDMILEDTVPVLTLKDSDSTGATLGAFMQFTGSDNVQAGFVGYGSTSNTDLNINNGIGNVVLNGINTIVTGGNFGVGSTAPPNMLSLGNSTTGAEFYLAGKTAASNDYLFSNTTGNYLELEVPGGTQNLMVWEPTGDVGIGTSTPGSYSFQTGAQVSVGSGSDFSTISVVSSTTSSGYLAFADGTTGDERFRGLVQYDHSTDEMLFRANGLTYSKISQPAAGETALWVYDADNATLERVTVGAADTGGAGFKVLRIPN